MYICGNIVLYLNAQIKQILVLFFVFFLLFFVCMCVYSFSLHTSHIRFVLACLFITWSPAGHLRRAALSHTHKNRERAAAGTMPSCLGLSVCKGRAVCPHQCQHVAYMYTAAGGPACGCTVCAYLCLLRPSPIVCS